ncbi:MAG: PilZ domain-containing protein [Deltaproteobacteria bacterium]|nr:PilZ domain-containing protein [Deltaproteobacteria bacterium]
MSEKRNMERRELIYYLKVRDVATDKELGRMVDIHREGLLLMGDRKLQAGKEYNISIEMPKAMMDQGIKNVGLKAVVMWAKNSQTTSFLENGLKFIDPSTDAQRTIDKLIEFFAMPNGTFNLS